MEVVGIVGDLKQDLAGDPKAEMYVSARQGDSLLPVFALSVVMRTDRDPLSEASALRSVVRDINPNQPVVRVRTMEENISGSVSMPRFRAMLLAIFAGTALVLAIVGLYGLMVYTVNQRVHEIGIRIALGANRGDVLRMVIAQGLKLALSGVLIGVLSSLALGPDSFRLSVRRQSHRSRHHFWRSSASDIRSAARLLPARETRHAGGPNGGPPLRIGGKTLAIVA